MGDLGGLLGLGGPRQGQVPFGLDKAGQSHWSWWLASWWLARAQPDVLLMQETKLADGDTPDDTFKAAGYTQRSVNIGQFAGQTLVLKFTGTEDSSLQTSFVLDDLAVNAS